MNGFWIYRVLSRSDQADRPDMEPVKQEQHAAEREQMLDAREKALGEWEATLKNREQELEQREKDLNERALLQTEPEEPDRDLSREMKELISAYKSFAEQVKLTGRDVVAMGHEVNRWHQDGLETLCRLCRDMTLTGDGRLLPWAQRLDMVLERKFHVESLEPRAGDDYDPERHERLDASRTGRKVFRCLTRGWQREDEVLLRAVVETE